MNWVAALTLGLAITASSGLGGQARRAATATVISHGLRITLQVPGPDYPANAVIPVTLSIRNTTRHAIGIMGGLADPNVEVFNVSGQDMYEPTDPLGDLGLIIPTGPVRFSRLAPHATWSLYDDVVLRGNTLVARIALGDRRDPGRERIIDRPRIKLTLTHEAAPTVTLSTAPLQATLSPPVPESGPLVFVSQTRCDDLSQGVGWSTQSAATLTPGTASNPAACTSYTWHAIAGWLGHPIATIVYQKPAPQK